MLWVCFHSTDGSLSAWSANQICTLRNYAAILLNSQTIIAKHHLRPHKRKSDGRLQFSIPRTTSVDSFNLFGDVNNERGMVGINAKSVNFDSCVVTFFVSI